MYSYFSDLHVDLLAQALLQPGEQRIGQTVGSYLPWWAFGLINETYLVIATDRRLILVEHRMAWLHQANKLQSVESIPWQNVREARIAGLLGKKLVVQGQSQSRTFSRKLRIPNALFGLLAPMRNNVGGARAVAAGFQATRGLSAAPAYAPLPAVAPVPALPPPPAAPDYALQTLPADYAQPYSQAPQAAPLPAFNSPGYASVPPAPPAPPASPASLAPPSRGVAPMPPRSPVGPRPPY